MTTIKFELGKFYRTRNGLKAQIFMLDNGKGIMLCAYFFNGAWLELALLKTGKLHDGTHEHNLDIVGEWREPIKYSVELWGNEFKLGPAETTLTIRMFGEFPRWNSAEKTEQCPIKYRVTVEELPNDSH